MESKNKSVFGIYKNSDIAERAVERIAASGFAYDDISVLLSDIDSTRDFAHQKSTKAPEGSAAGAVTGAALGGTLGLLAGIGTLAIPGIGPFIAAGPIMATLAGVGVGGTVGGLLGALLGMGIPEYVAQRYEGRVKEGGVLVSVHCDTSNEVSRAEELLKETGAEDVSSASEKAAEHR